MIPIQYAISYSAVHARMATLGEMFAKRDEDGMVPFWWIYPIEVL